MDLKQVEQLLEKYWEGSSSIEEEKLIQEFFASNDLPKHLEAYSDLFTSPELSIHPELGKEFDAAILNKIKAEPKANVWNAFKIAAIGLILLITSISVFQVDTEKQVAQDTFNTPEAALAETKRAFAMISDAMNKGEQQMIFLSKLDETNEKIKTQQ